MTGRPQDVQAGFAATLVDEWRRGGVRHAVVCPGSRSTPLALACAAAAAAPGAGSGGALRLHVHHDERSAGFLAVGLGLATGVPAVVVVTSGTAAAELHPAVVEAHQAGVPLLVCTANRPPELQDVGAPQTIDQTRLYGPAVRWFSAPGVPAAAESGRWRALAARAVAEATGGDGRPGPVHLDLAFREPLVGDSEAGGIPPGRPDGRPWAAPAPRRATVDPAAAGLDGLVGRRGVIVAGKGSGDGDSVHALAGLLGWPVLAEPRAPAWRPGPATVAHLDPALRSPVARQRLRPEVVVRLGPPPASRVVNEWLAASGAHEVVAAGWAWSDPAGTAATVVRSAPADLVAAWLPALTGDLAPPGWLRAWRAAADAAARTIARLLDPQGGSPHAEGAVAALAGSEPAVGELSALAGSEPAVARAVAAGLPAGAALVVSSSMPVRDVECYAAPRTGVRVLANRGANGIDGVVSTAVGVAAATGGPTALLIGDVAFLHDSNGLLGAADRGVDLVCVVVDNDGGGIFSFLPQATTLPGDRFERLFGTPHGLDLVALAAAYGVEAQAVDPAAAGAEAGAALAKGGVHVLVARTDRAANVDAHAAVDAAVAAAVDAAVDAALAAG